MPHCVHALSPGDGNGFTKVHWAYGDSITEGSDFGSGLEGYAYYIAKSKGWRHKNRGVGGSKIADSGQTTRALTDPIAQHDVVTFLTGYNDMRFVGNDSGSITTYAGYLDAILARWNSIGCKVYLGNCLTMTASAYSMYSPYDQGSDTAVTSFNTAISTTAAAYSNVTVVDVSSSWDPDTSGYLQGDLVHPSQTGASALSSLFLSAIG